MVAHADRGEDPAQSRAVLEEDGEELRLAAGVGVLQRAQDVRAVTERVRAHTAGGFSYHALAEHRRALAGAVAEHRVLLRQRPERTARFVELAA